MFNAYVVLELFIFFSKKDMFCVQGQHAEGNILNIDKACEFANLNSLLCFVNIVPSVSAIVAGLIIRDFPS